MIRTFHGITIPRYVYRIDRGNYSGWLVAVPGTPRKFYNDKRFGGAKTALSFASNASVNALWSLPNPYKPGPDALRALAERNRPGLWKRALFTLRRLMRA